MSQFKEKYGQHIHETRLPGQLYFEASEEKLADGLLYPETLAQVLSLAEENKRKALKPEVSRQMGLHLDNTLTIRKKALRLGREEGQPIEKALWTAYNGRHHRIEHRLTLLTIANSGKVLPQRRRHPPPLHRTRPFNDFRSWRKNSPSSNDRCRGRDLHIRGPKPFLLLQATSHSQLHPPLKVAAEDVERKRTARAEAKATRADLRFNRVSRLSTRSSRTRTSTGSSSTKPRTKRASATCFRETMCGEPSSERPLLYRLWKNQCGVRFLPLHRQCGYCLNRIPSSSF